MLATSWSGSPISRGICQPVRLSSRPTREPTVSGLRNGRLSMYQSQADRDRSLALEVARSRAINPAGCRISIWVSSIGTISDALPKAYAAMGRPRLPAFT